MKYAKINKIFESVQFIQLLLLITQGWLLISTKENQFSLPIWIALGVASLVQVIIVFFLPKRMKSKDIVNRSEMIRLRIIAVVPYILIIVGLIISKK
jgi:hypothetical protein